MDDYSNKALDAIAIYPESSIKKSLSDLIIFNTNRVK